MEIGSIFLILALFLLVGVYVGRPIIEKQNAQATSIKSLDHERSGLLAERDQLIDALKELEFDHILGKIPEEDYPSQKAYLLEKGVEVLRKLDTLEPADSQVSFEDRLEEAIAARRMQTASISAGNGNGSLNKPGRAAGAAVASPDDDLEILLANRKRERREKAAGFCPKCGGPIQKSDRFCPKCGSKTV